MKQVDALLLAVFAADVGNILARERNIDVRDIPVRWFQDRLLSQYNRAQGSRATADLIAEAITYWNIPKREPEDAYLSRATILPQD